VLLDFLDYVVNVAKEAAAFLIGALVVGMGGFVSDRLGHPPPPWFWTGLVLVAIVVAPFRLVSREQAERTTAESARSRADLDRQALQSRLVELEASVSRFAPVTMINPTINVTVVAPGGSPIRGIGPASPPSEPQ
jgi:uncharacterized membrane protein